LELTINEIAFSEKKIKTRSHQKKSYLSMTYEISVS